MKYTKVNDVDIATWKGMRLNIMRYQCPLCDENCVCKIMGCFCPSVDVAICMKLQTAYNKGFSDCHNLIKNKKLSIRRKKS